MEAMMAVPDQLVDEVALCGPTRAHRGTARRLKTCGDDEMCTWTIICGTTDINAIRTMAEPVLS